jgi:hypothetical protein
MDSGQGRAWREAGWEALVSSKWCLLQILGRAGWGGVGSGVEEARWVLRRDLDGVLGRWVGWNELSQACKVLGAWQAEWGGCHRLGNHD